MPSLRTYDIGTFLSNTTTIANAGTKSAAINMGGLGLVGIVIPAAFTGTALTFEVCDTADGTFAPLYNSSNTLVSMTIAQGRSYAVDPALFQGYAFIKFVSGSAESAARTITYTLRG